MMRLVPNSGIFNNEALDSARGAALTVCDDGLPEPLVYYLRDLERAYLDAITERKRTALREIGWKHTPAPEPFLTAALYEVLKQAMESRAPDLADASHPGWSDRARAVLARAERETAP